MDFKGKEEGRSATYHFGQIKHVPHVLKKRFRNDESPGKRLLRLLFRYPLEHPLHVLQIIVIIPPHRTPADLNSLPDGIIDGAVRNDDVPPLTERRDDA